MQLIQISEPETKIKTNDTSHAIGIDLGTTNSVVAYVINGKPEPLGPILPSVYQGIRSIKRLMGTSQKINDLTAIEISSYILKMLKLQAEEIIKDNITKAVITVPAHFNDTAKNATKLAAKLAGLDVLRLINEPTAASVAYGLDNQAEGIYLIYDLGGGTFDVSILNMQKGIFQVLATGGDSEFGGDDIDIKIMEHLNLTNNELLICRNAKEHLSSSDYWNKNNLSLSKNKLEEIAKPLITKTIEICIETIESANINPSDINEVILVGGSTRMPLVKQMLEASIKTPLDNIDPDLVVAKGAAIQAYNLIHGSDHLLLDVTSLSIGIEIMGGICEKIINKNSTIPTSVTKYFTTHADGQTGMIIHVVQGEREMVKDCRSLAKFELKGIPPMKASSAKVAITFNIDADGLLTVSAIEENTKTQQHVEIKPSFGLSEDEVEKMIIQSYENASYDIKEKQIAENIFKAQNDINNINKALNDDNHLLSVKEKSNIINLIKKLEAVIDSNDLNKIENAIKALETEASPFLQNRLNKQIAQALQGKLTSEIIKKQL